MYRAEKGRGGLVKKIPIEERGFSSIQAVIRAPLESTVPTGSAFKELDYALIGMSFCPCISAYLLATSANRFVMAYVKSTTHRITRASEH